MRSRERLSASHFDTVAEGYDESLPAHVVEYYLHKHARFVIKHCPKGKGWRWDPERECSPSGSRRREYEMVGVHPSRGRLDVADTKAPRASTPVASGMSLPFSDDDGVGPRDRLGPRPVQPYWGRLMARVP